MKKIVLLLTALYSFSLTYAQDDLARAQDNFTIEHENDTSKHCCCMMCDADLAPWVLDINLLGGGLSQSLSNVSMKNTYTNSVNNNISDLKFKNGSSFGFDAQIGYFFGQNKHFGIGTGIMLLQQNGDLTLDQFHTEYQSTDNLGSAYRQVLTANNGIKEKLSISNINIPLVFKYKTQISGRWGFAADAGVLFNLQIKNSYNSNASFDYEAIYAFDNNNNPIYDNAATPNPNDWLITKSQFNSKNPGGDVATYFNSLATRGYNVGLGVKPTSNTGNVSYKTGSVGLLLQPSASYLICEKLSLNFGLYYIYQTFNNNANNAYRITDKVGQYSSLLNSVSTSNNSSYGLNVGIRYYFGLAPDRDHDGVPDKNDRCPDVPGPKKFHGCPDRDGDGIPDIDDECPDQPGLAKFNGCPDTDGDGIPDNLDECPTIPGLPQFNGCPDSDGDGIPDKDDDCPHTPGLLKFHGCPDTDGDGVPDNIDQCPTVPGPPENHGCPYPPKPETTVEENNDKVDEEKEVVRFETGKAVIKKSTYHVLDNMAKDLKKHPEADVEIDGHTDITGGDVINKKLSAQRALAVKNYLIKKGIPASRIKTKAYGSKIPEATNKTPKGRAKNRRAVLKMKYSMKYSDNN